MNEADTKASIIKEEAAVIAKELVEHAKETARQMLLNTTLDVSKIPLICNKVVQIQSDIAQMRTDQIINMSKWEKISSDLAWMKWLGSGFVVAAGMLALKSLGL